jgi:hypothetical protein
MAPFKRVVAREPRMQLLLRGAHVAAGTFQLRVVLKLSLGSLGGHRKVAALMEWNGHE